MSGFGQTNPNSGQAATSAFGQAKFSGFGQPASSGTASAASAQPVNTRLGKTIGTGFGQPSNTGFGLSASTGQGQTIGTNFGQPTSTGPVQGFGLGQTTGNATSGFCPTSSAPAFSGFGSGTGSFGTMGLGQTVPVQKQTTGFGSSLFGNSSTASQTSQPALGSGFGAFKSATTSGFGTSFGTQSKLGASGESTQKPAFSATDVSIIKDAFERCGILRAARVGPTLLERAVTLQRSLDPETSSYLFQGYFYNMVHPSQVQSFKVNNTQPAYQLALESNPEPRCMVPVPAMGFGGLLARSELLCQTTQRHHAALNKLQEKIKKINKIQAEEVAKKLENIKESQAKICQRLTAISKTASVLSNSGVPIRPKEESLRRQLESIQAELIKPHQFSILLTQFRNCPPQKPTSDSALSSAEKLHGTLLQNDEALALLKTRLEEDLAMTKMALAKAGKA